MGKEFVTVYRVMHLLPRTGLSCNHVFLIGRLLIPNICSKVASAPLYL